MNRSNKPQSHHQNPNSSVLNNIQNQERDEKKLTHTFITKAITLYKKMKWYCLSLNKTCCIIHFMYFHSWFCVQKMPHAQLISLWCVQRPSSSPRWLFSRSTSTSQIQSTISTIHYFCIRKTYQERDHLTITPSILKKKSIESQFTEEKRKSIKMYMESRRFAL